MRILLMALLLMTAARAEAWGEERVDLPTRPGVTQRVYITPAADPVATAILFPGGDGVYASMRQNFLVRIVPDLVRSRVSVVVVDAPSDQAHGMSWPFRQGADHARDIGAVIDFAKTRSPTPMWLIGTSTGTISAANGAAAAGTRIHGLILTSSVWARGMAAVPLERIVVPVLIVHNRDDGCQESPFAGVTSGMARLTAAPVRQFLPVSGGSSRSGACQALSPHGYWGIEQLVVPPMVNFIEAH
jgi:pimeloyl-ACP methyl ester carboxylesterase